MLRWLRYQGLTGWDCFDGDRRVGQVVWYDRPPGWVGFLGGVRVEGGPWDSDDAAKAAVERVAVDATKRPEPKPGAL